MAYGRWWLQCCLSHAVNEKKRRGQHGLPLSLFLCGSILVVVGMGGRINPLREDPQGDDADGDHRRQNHQSFPGAAGC